MSWIPLVLVGMLFFVHQAVSSGVFELRLESFDNEAGKDDMGKCCTGKTKSNFECDGLCRPRFRICLKEYQVKIDATSPCTFGDVMTSELGPDPVSDKPTNGFANSINFPIPFTWTGAFSLIVEAWHGNQTVQNSVLVSRMMRQTYLHVGDQWTEDTYRSKYSTLRFEYRVTCDPNYYGSGCENLCRPRDDNFGHYSCSPIGDRVCLAGWTGDYCTKPQCTPGCHEQHGHCTKPNECNCQSGWEGPLCNQCQRYPGCMHGTCVKSWDCLCVEGWGGLFCNQDLNFCTNHKPCRNGGTCFNTGQGSYTCSCPAGFTGTDCEIPLNDCSRTACLNGGTCESDGGTYNVCSCPFGFAGPRCETSTTTCADRPCRHGSTCTDTDLGYLCACRPGFSGADCEHQVNVCSPNPCKNDGTCAESADGFQCICPSGFAGPTCETNVDDCLGNPCQNGGTCVDQINEFRCHCVPGYVGPLCQNRVDYCITKPCANGGTCLQLVNDYRCKCAPGFTGKDCSEEIDECSTLNPCEHGGTCVNRVHGYDCLCAAGYAGRQCQDVASSCLKRPCLNGGTCVRAFNEFKCKCAPGFAGKECAEAADVADKCPNNPCQHGGTCVRRAAGYECLCPAGFLGSDCEEVSSSAAPSARVSSDSNLSTKHVVIIATISTFVPFVVLFAVVMIACLKQRKKREKARADEEARLQNEQNTANSSFAKRGAVSAADPHVIKNSWGKCTNNAVGSNLSSPDDCSVSNVSVADCVDGFPKPLHQVIDGRPVYGLQRTRSQKQLNTETGARASALLAAKLHESDYEHIKRLSVMSNASSAVCASDASLLKRPTEKESNGVYVIEEHFHVPDAISSGLFATEV